MEEEGRRCDSVTDHVGAPGTSRFNLFCERVRLNLYVVNKQNRLRIVSVLDVWGHRSRASSATSGPSDVCASPRHRRQRYYRIMPPPVLYCPM